LSFQDREGKLEGEGEKEPSKEKKNKKEKEKERKCENHQISKTKSSKYLNQNLNQ
jgi:hypothetical protein